MTLDLYTTQQDIKAYLTAQLAYPVYDTDFPAVENEPAGENGVMASYVVIRFNDALRTTTARRGGGGIGGARHDDMYTLVDVLAVGHSPEEARRVAYGDNGVSDILTGYAPVDGGPMERSGGGQVFVRSDGTGARPSNFVAIVSFRLLVNMIIDE